MLTVVDAFQRAVEDGRRALSDLEGRNVTITELVERSSLPKSRLKSVYNHLDPSKERKRGHRVPPDIVHALAEVLPQSERELMAAAQEAAGYEVRAEAPYRELGLSDVVVRYLEDIDSDEDRTNEAWQLIDIIQRTMRERRRSDPES